MFGSFFSKKNEPFYLPGEEIKLDKSFSFLNYSCEKDPLSTCKNRVAFAICMFFLVFSILTIRLFNICISFDRPETTIAEADRFYALPENPIKRADIIDRNGTIIATSLPTVHLFANPKKIDNPQKAAVELSRILPDIRYEDILAKLQKKGSFVYIKRNLTPSQQYQINALGIPGLEFEDSEKRIYPHKNLFAHLIGATNIDNVGISGIEKQLDERLRNSDIPLQLSIDAGIQDTIRQELQAGIDKFHALGGTAILMDTNTSEIIAMVSLPDFDPNRKIKVSDRATFNFATKGLYEPGSVLKVFNAALGLEKGHVKLTDRFDATKPIKLRYNVIKDYRGENRWLDLQEILIYSSNIGSAQIALKVGKEKQQNFLKSLGLFSSLKNFEVAEKASPILPRVWGEATTATVAYGYGISVTPLHLATAFSAVVNGGVYHQPSVLLSEKTASEGIQVLSKKTSENMRQLLRGVVVEGSAKRANILGYEVAGKTGTANKLVNGKYIDKKVMTSFLGTFPVSNPRYTLMLMMDEPKPLKETWGFVTSGWNTVPTAGNIIKAIAPQLNIQANYDLEEMRNNRIIEAAYER